MFCNYSHVHRDVRKLLELELLARDKDGKVYVPWKDVVLNVSLTGDTLAA
jgi:predicted transcriptional regulator